MSPDEFITLVVCGLIALFGWIRWYRSVASATALGSSARHRVPLYLTPPACAIVLLVVLRYFAAEDVRDSVIYVGFYLVMGAAWVAAARVLLPLLGISPRGDAVERRNPAAVCAVSGALLGITLCFAGGNIGSGPGWWVVVFSAILSSAAWFGLWGLIGKTTHLADAITIDRDLASSLRLSGFLVAAGLILGRAVAGNWVSAAMTVGDFVKVGWPAVALAGGEIALSALLRPSPQRPTLPIATCGLLPALVYLGAAVVYVLGIGRW